MHTRTRPTHVYKLYEGPEVHVERIPESTLVDVFQEYDDTGFEPRLEFLYRAISCTCIDSRSLTYGRLWFDDEGLFKASPVPNPIATALYHEEYRAHGGTDLVHGHAVLVFNPEYDGLKAELRITMTLDSVLTRRALSRAGEKLRSNPGATAADLMELATSAHADEDYALAAALYAAAVQRGRGKGDIEQHGIVLRAGSAMQRSIENLAAHCVTLGHGW